MDKYLPTGNEYVSLPTVNEDTACIETLSFLSMTQKGMVELRGSEEVPLMVPLLQVRSADNGWTDLPLSHLHWRREHYWIPRMEAIAGNLKISMTILAPVGERGFAIRLSATAHSNATVRLGLRGRWAGAWHCVNEDKSIEGRMSCYESSWNDGIVFDLRCGYPMLAFAPMSDRPIFSSFAGDNDGIGYSLFWETDMKAGEPTTITFFWGLGFEEVAATTSAKEMLRWAWDREYEKTARWLDVRAHSFRREKLTGLYNTNLFFCLFYATGRTLDTEELVCMTSRSPRYYVSAAYWDRDTLLWSFPAILDADPDLARDILTYIFTRQRRNFGIHSRYIDGTVLEPGFELDELTAPIIALSAYVEATGDSSLLEERFVIDGLEDILKKLAAVRHSGIDLYETFLQPTDDERVHPYLTYDNVLVWLALTKLARLLPDHFGPCEEQARQVKEAIYQHCVFRDENGRPYFGWSVDLKGSHDVYDEPPGSLQLLPYYGFCSPEDEVWRNTVSMIRSPEYKYSFAGEPIAEIGCPHAPYPWVLSLCNSLLCGHAGRAWAELEHLEMDNGIACESVHPVEGTCMTGAAFATCAGFLCHSMRVAEQEGSYER